MVHHFSSSVMDPPNQASLDSFIIFIATVAQICHLEGEDLTGQSKRRQNENKKGICRKADLLSFAAVGHTEVA